MIVRLLAVLAGIALICGGLWYSPAPWLAPIFGGGALAAVGLLLRVPDQ